MKELLAFVNRRPAVALGVVLFAGIAAGAGLLPGFRRPAPPPTPAPVKPVGAPGVPS